MEKKNVKDVKSQMIKICKVLSFFYSSTEMDIYIRNYIWNSF